MIIKNDELGVELEINEKGHKLRSTRPRYESIFADDRIIKWEEEQLKNYYERDTYLSCGKKYL